MSESPFMMVLFGLAGFALVSLVVVGSAVWLLRSTMESLKRWTALCDTFPVKAQPEEEWKKPDWLVVNSVMSFRSAGRVSVSDAFVWIEPPAVFAPFVGSVQIPIESTQDARADARQFSFVVEGLEIKMPGDLVPLSLMKRLDTKQ